MAVIDMVSKELNMKPNELLKESLKTYLEKRLSSVEADIFLLLKKYGVRDVFELDEKVQEGIIREKESYEDYFLLDNLEAEREKIRKLFRADLMATFDDIKRITEIEFADVVKNIHQIDYKLRIILINNSFVDVHVSQRLIDKFGFHWECMDDEKTIYRYDNFPDKNWQSIATFPYHFHNDSQDIAEDSPFPYLR